MTRPGTPCWVDVNVADTDLAAAFYGAVLGWECSTGRGGHVTATVGGSPVAGLSPQRVAGMTSTWTLYLASDDVEADAAAAERAGGTVYLEPAGGSVRTAVVGDPSGAHVGLWQGEKRSAAGGLAWEDLRSTDPDAARAFYAAVFGYRYEPVPAAGPDYTTFALDDEPLGGIGGLMGAPEGSPSHWIVYFAVADADAAVAACQDAGGSVLAPAFDNPYGRMAGLLDPFGARFWVVAG